MNPFISSIRFNFLYIDLYAFGKTWFYPESVLPYQLLRYITRGSAVFFVDGMELTVHAGQVIYLSQGTTLSCHALSEDFQFYSLRFTSAVHYETGDLLTEYYHVQTITEDREEQAKELFEQMFQWIKSDATSRMFWVRGYLDLLIGYVIDHGIYGNKGIDTTLISEDFTLEKVRRRIQKTNIKMDARIQVVIDYMVLHPTENYTIRKMSDMAELSESRFRAIFKNQIGKSPLGFLSRGTFLRWVK